MDETSKNLGGRPTKWSRKLALEICAELAEGRSLRAIVRKKSMPAMSTIFRWLDKHQWFREQYARAREAGADALADDIQDIASRVLVGGYDPQAARVAVDAMKWVASKQRPKKYGEKLDIDQTTEVTHKFEDMTDEQLDREIKARKDRIS